MKYLDFYPSPLGMITLASDGTSLIGLWFDGQKYDRDLIKKEEVKEKNLPVFEESKRWLDQYFAGMIPKELPPIRLSGSPFRQLVGDIMLSIPLGKTMTYGQIAKEAASRMGEERMSAQAVGGAVGHNSLSIMVPCHRVVGSDGSMTGYAGGIEKKRWLLEHEQKMIR